MRSKIQSKFFYPLLFLAIIGISNSCTEPNKTDDDDESTMPGRVQILFKGVTTEDSVEWANFTLLNDSTMDISYFAYSATHPHYSTQMLSDTGWVWLFWNWCGTGASYIPLESGTSIDFRTGLPHLDCTWRVTLGIHCESGPNDFILRSDPIPYTTP